MKYKKGDAPKIISAAPIATLVAVIALFMVLYILLLPPAERHELLNITEEGKTSIGGERTSIASKAEILLSKAPGLVSLDIEDKNEHEMNPVSLFIKVEPEVATLINSMYVSRNMFSNKFQELSFAVRDISSLESATIVFNVDSNDGRLIIELNGNKVYDKETAPGLATVQLPLGYLKEQNTLKFYASSPGALFFTSNKYTLSGVKISQKYSVVNARSTRTFTVTSAEKENIDKLLLNFAIYCETLSRPEGRLKVAMNDYVIYSDAVICDKGAIKTEVDSDYLNKGENTLEFEIDKGDYTIDPITVITELKKGALLTYNFFLETKEHDDVWTGKKKVKLNLLFADDSEKNARFDINGDTVRLSTKETEWDRDISGNVKEGNNFIKIIPANEFTINSLEIRLE